MMSMVHLPEDFGRLGITTANTMHTAAGHKGHDDMLLDEEVSGEMQVPKQEHASDTYWR